jgi:outer membrane protein OmpA-like peptidoglycan-associated protein
VQSHTDSRATDQYNIALSQRLNESTKNWIIQKGNIDPSRISGRGYGETQLVNRCSNGVKCSEEEHQQNRRSMFIVTSN